MKSVENNIKGAIPTDFDISAQAHINSSVQGRSQSDRVMLMEHSGTIRVEGVNDKGQLNDVVDIIIGRLRQEVRV